MWQPGGDMVSYELVVGLNPQFLQQDHVVPRLSELYGKGCNTFIAILADVLETPWRFVVVNIRNVEMDEILANN
jgi:hypothetical protein